MLEDRNIIADRTKDVEKLDEEGLYQITTVDGYVFEVYIDESKTELTYIGKKDKLLPVIRAITVTGKSTSTIDIQIKGSRLDSGTISYYYKKTSEENYTELKTKTTDITASYTGLEHHTSYDIKVVATNKNGSNESIIQVTTRKIGEATEGLQEGVIIASTPTWNNGTASITLSTTTGLTIQWQKNGISGTWTTGTEVTGLNHNETVFARLTDGTNYGDEASITIVDSIAPSGTFSALSEDNLTIEFTPTDNASIGNNIWKYRLSTDGGNTYGAWRGLKSGYDNTQTYELKGNVNVPTITSSKRLNLFTNNKYQLQFDHMIASGSTKFDCDLHPDSLPQTYPTATTSWQKYIWDNIISSSTDMGNCVIRLFNDQVRPNPATISIKNINLYAKDRGRINLSYGQNVIQVKVTDDAGNTNIVTSNQYTIKKLATGISLDKTDALLAVNNTLTLTATVTPTDASNKNVTWSSSDTNIAIVNSNGIVTAKAPGTVTITAKTSDGSNQTATCTVTVTSWTVYTNDTVCSGTIAVSSSTSNPTILKIENSSSQYVFARLAYNGSIKTGDEISVNYCLDRSSNSYYLDLVYGGTNGGDGLIYSDAFYLSSGTYTKTFTAKQDSNGYAIQPNRSDVYSTGWWLTMYIYDVSINGKKVL